MSKTENITCDDVKDIIRLACPYYEKKSALHNYDSFMLVENPLCNLLLSKSAFPAPQNLPEIETERGFLRPLEETGKDFFVCNIDTLLLRTSVLDVVDLFIDRKKYHCCYQRALKEDEKEVIIKNRHVFLSALEHATRLLPLCGIEQAELYDIGDSLVFIGRKEGKIAAAIKIEKKTPRVGYKSPVVNILPGGLSFSTDSEIHADLILSTIKTLDEVNEVAEDHDYLFAKLYEVSLVMRTDVFVLAHSKEEARKVAMNDVNVGDEFSDDFDIENCAEASIEDVPTEGDCRVYCEGGPIDCDEFHETFDDKLQEEQDLHRSLK